MDRNEALSLLYPKAKSGSEFRFDNLYHPPIFNYLTIQDIAQLNKIATSVRLSSKPKEKYKMINQIMVNRGFVKMASGTNRVVYRFLDDYSFVLKIAIDKVGMKDNPAEMRNQHLLKPFVTKCFDVTRCGTVGMFERVKPIQFREEFLAISEDVFDLINNLVGKYVLEDIGEKYFQNYGVRDGFGPVLLDYPYVYELDGGKLICNNLDPITNLPCRGEIDYDLGYNDLVCKKCGKRYLATDLKMKGTDGEAKIIIEGKEETRMKVAVLQGDKVIKRVGGHKQTNVIKGRRPEITSTLRVNGVESVDVNEDADERRKELMDIKTSDDTNFKFSVGTRKIKSNNNKNKNQNKNNNSEKKPQVPSVYDTREKIAEVKEKIREDKEKKSDVRIEDAELYLDIKSGFMTDKEGNVIGKLNQSQYDMILKSVAYYTKYMETKEKPDTENDSNDEVTEDYIGETGASQHDPKGLPDEPENIEWEDEEKPVVHHSSNDNPTSNNYTAKSVSSKVDSHYASKDLINEAKKSELIIHDRKELTDEEIENIQKNF